jgi:hypothetical protein
LVQTEILKTWKQRRKVEKHETIVGDSEKPTTTVQEKGTEKNPESPGKRTA